MNDNIKTYCQTLEKEYDLIPEKRKQELESLSNYISNKFKENQTPKIIVICTHNSRRSHIGQLWLAAGADYFQLPEIETFSGGTEATAFNTRAVNAFKRTGFEISTYNDTAVNPLYEIKWKQDMSPYQAFSKKYGDTPNPQSHFAAIMVCTSADEGCPVVFGCDFRLSLPYDDPKDFDDTVQETEKYDERVRQIGREILYALSKVEQT